jgi:hypothetical protein
MKKKLTTKETKPGADALMRIADRLGTQARRADNRLNGRDKIRAFFNREEPSVEQFKNLSGEKFLELLILERDGLNADPDAALASIVGAVDRIAEKDILNDPKLDDLHAKMVVIRKREGLKEDEYFELNDPETPKDWLALNEKYDRRVHEIQAAILRRYGEDEIADLMINDQATLTRRSFAGLRKMNQDDPKKLAELNKMEKELLRKKAGATPS